MTSDQITQLHRLLRNAQDCAKDTNIEQKMKIDSNQAYKWIMQDMFHWIDKALALLPCPTCNGTGMPKVKSPGAICPDCQ